MKIPFLNLFLILLVYNPDDSVNMKNKKIEFISLNINAN